VKVQLIVVGPLPPPYHGVTVSTSLVLRNPRLHESFDVRHVDTSDKRSGENIGRWDIRNVVIATRSLITLWRNLRSAAGLVYLPISQSGAGFMRDSLLIHIAALRGWKIAGHLRGSDFREFYDACPPALRTLIRQTLGRLTSVAVMGESLRWVFDGIVAPDRIAVVPNGTPEPTVDRGTRNDLTVLFLSSLRRRKGVVEAVDAARLVTRRHDSVRFLFVGEWENDRVEQKVKRRVADASSRIEFRPPAVGLEKDRLLASASILLFPPTEREGHPRVVIEALAAATPVVATEQGAIGETIVDGECGFLLPRAEPRLLAERMLRLLNDRELLASMGDAARRRYLERFTQRQADKTLADWLQSLVTA
jgi:glycosyltransferase involved in cell wall biosynthesis